MTRRLLPFLALTLAAGCSQRPPATGCRTDAQCAADARCTSGVCTADTRPTAAVRPVAAVEEFALVRLDGTASADPDGDLAEHEWTVRSVDARCAPPEVSGRTAEALVRFGCPGRYEVTLTVKDTLGIASEPAHTDVIVSPSSGAPIVLAGPDLATDHLCSGSAGALRCRATEQVHLVSEAAPGVTLRWTVLPPAERPLDEHRRVTFLPTPYAAAPVAEIVTDGTAISGDWIFRVEATDAYGVIGAAHTRVSVRNRPPIVTFSPAGPFEHAFDPARSVFTAQGAVGWSVVDLDGDPVSVEPLWRHVGDGDAGLFDGELGATTATFSVEVPYAAPEDALRLRGGADLLRRIELSAVDSNRALGLGVFDVEIGNRPPVPAGGTFDTVVPHRFDAQRSQYVASLRAGTFVDPDGDPLVDSSGGPAPCGAIHVHGNDVTVECAVAYEGVPAVERLAGVRSIPVAVRDPWDAATAVPVRTVTIQNAAPVLSGAPVPATRCVTSFSTRSISGTTTYFEEHPVTFDVQPGVTDPDGDPIQLRAVPVPGGSVNPSGAVCTAPECVPFRFFEPFDAQVAGLSFAMDRSALSASDGAAQVQLDVSPAWALTSYCP